MLGLIGKTLRDLPRLRRAPATELGSPLAAAGSDSAMIAAPTPLPPHHIVASLLAGTRLLTRHGEVPVETLDSGQLVMSLGVGAHWRPVLRVVERLLQPSDIDGAPAERPILIRAGALMAGSPMRDLHVAPGQGIWLEGMVVPADLLVNGVTILRERHDAPLPCHDVYMLEPVLLIADGAVVESGPGGEEGPGAAPLLLDGPALDAIRDRLGRRAREAAAMA